MSKKLGLVLTFTTVFLIILYFAYDFSLIQESVAIEFMSSYLNNFQAYFFVFTLVLIPIILFEHIPFSSIEYLIRIKGDILSHVMKEMIVSSVKYAAIIFSFFMTSSFIFRFTFSFEFEFFKMFVILFNFILTCYLLFYAIYFLTGNFFLSIKVLLFVNFIYISSIMALNFMLPINLNLDLISMSFLFVVAVVNFSYLAFQLNRKEWLN